MQNMETTLYYLFSVVPQTLAATTALIAVFLLQHVMNLSGQIANHMAFIHRFWSKREGESIDLLEQNKLDELINQMKAGAFLKHARLLEERYQWGEWETDKRLDLEHKLETAERHFKDRARNLNGAKWSMGLAGVTIVISLFLLSIVTVLVKSHSLVVGSILGILVLSVATIGALSRLAYRVLTDF